ncbi:MAG TPA: fatty acyl-AMP ligase [Thermoanaerobaculia bacterium]|jgi:acyl-CoA synthetase (AMP-forming)/AMP-acid ligase II|nr:fatty acyl-AMP ligase [Thermoanaerobaculia bacterium]
MAARPQASGGTVTLLDLLARVSEDFQGGLRFIARDESATWHGWADVRARAEAVAGNLAASGVVPGDRIALVYPTGIDFFAALFGTLLAGAVPVPLYPPVRLGRLDEYFRRTARMLELARARLVLADARVQRILGQTIALARPPLGCKTLDQLPKGGAMPGGAAVSVRPDDLALVQYSSGTTVDPKPVALSHRAVIAQIAALNLFWRDTPEHKHSGVSWLPLYHDMGLIGCVFPSLARDATLTLIGPELFIARPAIWLRTLSKYRGTISPAPNFGYALCLSRVSDDEIEGLDLSAWEAALNGAEAAVPATMRAFAARFAPYGFRPEAFTPVYGLSEAALAVTFSDLAGPFVAERFDREALASEGVARVDGEGREITSVGRPLPGYSVRVADENGLTVPEGTIGRVWASGPSLMTGYLDQPEATERALRGGWLDTGDLGFLHRGDLYLTGRAKDVVILRGRNYAPEEIERAVDSVPGVRTGCAVAASFLPEGADGEELVLLVETARGITPEQRAALPRACRDAVLGAVGVPVGELVLLAPGTLPRTSSGKLRRGEALRLHLAGELTAPETVTPLRLAGALARSGLAYARLRLKKKVRAHG